MIQRDNYLINIFIASINLSVTYFIEIKAEKYVSRLNCYLYILIDDIFQREEKCNDKFTFLDNFTY